MGPERNEEIFGSQTRVPSCVLKHVPGSVGQW